MARGRNAKQSSGTVTTTTGPSEEDIFKLHQYDGILQLRDAILSGTHPRIKLPPGTGLSGPASTPINVAAQTSAQGALPKNLQSFSSNAQRPGDRADSFRDVVVGAPPTGPRAFWSGRAEINPILLEKSDDLIRAELQLQRQRLERALKEEVEQRRVAKHAQAEPLADFDLSDVLVKALTLVQATAPPLPANEHMTANNDAASDSFDDNTFYSSRHDTPESHLTSRVPNESEDDQAGTAGHRHHILGGVISRDLPGLATGTQAANPAQLYMSYQGASSNATTQLPSGGLVPGLNNYVDGVVSSSGPSQNTSGEQSQSEDSGNLELDQQGRAPVRDARRQLNDAYAAAHPPSPLVRAHDISPLAPQPSQISSLAVAGRFPQAQAVDPSSLAAITTTGTPAQVIALRNEPGVVTSPESSPQGGRASDKKKGKKKKRKADRQAPEVEAAPYIKPEPRSPSPLANLSYIRPNKRPRQSQRQAEEPGYDAPRYEPAAANGSHEHHQQYPYRDERVPIGYESRNAYPQRAASTAILGEPRYGAEYIDDRRISGEVYARRHPSPGASAFQYSSGGAHIGRPASRLVVNEPYMEPPRSYHEPYDTSRMTARPENEFYAGPPRPRPARIVVDASGREYLEPPRPSARQSIAPPIRPSEAEILYEHAPARAVSRHPAPGSYEEGNIVYARPSPPYAMPRRVVTQPEYMSQEYRESRPREYSTRPMAPQGEYVQVMAPPDRRQVDEGPPRDYIARATSMRPAEPVRYGVPQDYGRVQSVRPEVPPREYAASVHPEGRREMVQSYARGYGGSIEQPAVRREYSVRPMERYYEPQARSGDEIAFIERPRGATQEVVYTDDARREVYR